MKVSVITITYNNVENLKKTLNALKQQDYKEIESIIVDGGSTDGTIDIIKQFEAEFHGEVKWISEKDKGVYDAVNKGIRMATGDIIGCYWDVFASKHVISKIVTAIKQKKVDGVHGDLYYMNGDKIIRRWRMGQGTIQRGWMPGHPTLYLKRKVYETYGLYQDTYRISGDYEFMVRILKDHKVKLAYLPEVLIHMFYGGVSTSGWTAYKHSIQEGNRALKENHIRFPWGVTFLRILRTSLQFL